MAFIGLRVPEQAAVALSQVEVPGEPEPPEWFHVTMVYLGDHVPVDKLAKCMDVILRLTEGRAPFPVTIRSTGSFPPHPEKKTVPILGKVESEELHAFREEVCRALKAAGIAYDEKFPVFKPHVTLAYSKDPLVAADHAADGDVDPPVTWEVDGLVMWGGDHGEDRVSMTFPFGTEAGVDKQAMMRTAADISKAACGGACDCGCGGKGPCMTSRLVAKAVTADEDHPPAVLFKLFNEKVQAFLQDQDKLLQVRKTAEKMKTPGSLSPEEQREVLQASSTVIYTKWPQYTYVWQPAMRFFMGVLRSLVLPDALRKKVEAAARGWNKKPSRPRKVTGIRSLDDLVWYERQTLALGTQLDLAQKVLAAGKGHTEAPADDQAAGEGGTRVKVGPFTLVNTGGFPPDVMKNMTEIVSKAVGLIQRSGFGACLYGDIQITNTLMRSTVMAFYSIKDDNLYIRANGKPEWDTVHTVIHELGHRWENKKLRKNVPTILYMKVRGQEQEPPPPPIGDKVTAKGKTYEVARIEKGRGGTKVILREEGSTGVPRASIGLDGYYAFKGLNRRQRSQTDPNYKGFVTDYAQKSPAENFAEMFAAYCMDELPVHQSVMFEELVLGDGEKTARDQAGIREVLATLGGRPQ